jgi:hypothetical protein
MIMGTPVHNQPLDFDPALTLALHRFRMEHVRKLEADISSDNIRSLLDQPIRYQQADGNIVECTIIDFGTSHHRFAGGKYYTVVHSKDGKEVNYTVDEVKSILEKRIE